MPNTLQSYNPNKIKLIFHGFDLKVEEADKSIQLNQYANSLFTSFSINSSKFEDKKGVFVSLKIKPNYHYGGQNFQSRYLYDKSLPKMLLN